MKAYRWVLITLTLVIALVVAGWLPKRLDLSAVFCPLCWKEALWLVKRQVKKLLLIPQETLCSRRLCASNLIVIAVAILKYYVPEHNGFLPPQEGWEHQIRGYIKNDFVFRCPNADPSQRRFYRLNPQLSGRRLKEVVMPEKTVLVFECDENGHPVARHHFLEFRHCCHVVFAHGRIGHLTVKQVQSLIGDK